jgi:hypothetical protein
MDEAKMHTFMSQLAGPSPVPGLSGRDVVAGTKGCGPNGHSIYPPFKDALLVDTALHARVAHWLQPGITRKSLKDEAKKASLAISGSKKVLALRLALKNLPAQLNAAAASPAGATQVNVEVKQRRQSVGVSPVLSPLAPKRSGQGQAEHAAKKPRANAPTVERCSLLAKCGVGLPVMSPELRAKRKKFLVQLRLTHPRRVAQRNDLRSLSEVAVVVSGAMSLFKLNQAIEFLMHLKTDHECPSRECTLRSYAV